MNLDFNIIITAFKGDEQVGSYTRDTSNANDVSVIGVSGPRSFIYLRFSSSMSWAFLFNEESSGLVTLDRLIQFDPSKIFSGVTTESDIYTYEEPDIINLGSSSKSFICNHRQLLEYIPRNIEPSNTIFKVSVTIKKFQVQAYKVNEGQFSTPVHCSADYSTVIPPPSSTTTTTTTTTTVTTTAKPTTTTTSVPKTTTRMTTDKSTTIKTTTPMTTDKTTTPFVQPPVGTNSYTVDGYNDNICISVFARIHFDITYQAKLDDRPIQKKTHRFGIPTSTSSDGNCSLSQNHQRLSVFFYDDWELTLIFQLKENINVNGEDNQKNVDYSIANITLRYRLDHNKFPYAVKPDGTIMIATSNPKQQSELPEKIKGKAYYQCISDNNFALDDNVRMTTSHMKFKAFNKNKEYEFKGAAVKCGADDKPVDDYNWLPILGWVFLTLFLLLVLLLIIFLVCRKRNSTYMTI